MRSQMLLTTSSLVISDPVQLIPYGLEKAAQARMAEGDAGEMTALGPDNRGGQDFSRRQHGNGSTRF